MLRHCSINAAKKWLKFVVKNRDGVLAYFRVIDLPKEFVDNFVEFQINHFVKTELTHLISGIPNSVKALDEYRDIIKNIWTTPPYYSVICCPEVDGNILPEIVASSTIRLLKKSDLNNDYPAKTIEVKRFYKMNRYWDSLCPVSGVMDRHVVDSAFEYYALAVHPDYARRGIAGEVGLIGRELCKTHNVPLNVAWMMSDGSRKPAAKNGWTTEFKIGSDEVSKKFNVTFQNPPAFFHLMSYKL